MTQAAIIGAGIGGLTAALALHEQGIGVTVFEQAHQLEEAGAGIQLACNPNHVLRELGLLDAAATVAFEPSSLASLGEGGVHNQIKLRVMPW
jgi:2-polyprenyl-6-methoxyphenol hydroxylase-like FAD-dependent oxidoreductase